MGKSTINGDYVKLPEGTLHETRQLDHPIRLGKIPKRQWEFLRKTPAKRKIAVL